MVVIADSGLDERRGLTHIDGRGKARMVDITGKAETRRVAEARCRVLTLVNLDRLRLECPGAFHPLKEAQIAGVLGAKQTSSLIPLCHPIGLDAIEVSVYPSLGGYRVVAVAGILDRTGVEMEALTGCAMAALTLLRAVRGIDPLATIDELTVWHKSGGRSGMWDRRKDSGYQDGFRGGGSDDQS
jgi:cyclic pyranopterin phosphate synthase